MTDQDLENIINDINTAIQDKKEEVRRLEKRKAAIEKYDKTLVAQNEVLAELTRIAEDAYTEKLGILGTYAYDRIAEGVLELVEKYKEGKE